MKIIKQLKRIAKLYKKYGFSSIADLIDYVESVLVEQCD